jgi:hypothetical protein
MTKSVDVDMRAAAWTEGSGETRREVLDARLIAGVSVPDSPLITEVLEYAQTLYEPYLFNHARAIVAVRGEDRAVERHRLRPRGGRGRHHPP